METLLLSSNLRPIAAARVEELEVDWHKQCQWRASEEPEAAHPIYEPTGYQNNEPQGGEPITRSS
jgi:hypothetical protein